MAVVIVPLGIMIMIMGFNNNNILEIYTYLMVQTESLNATASAALPPERLKQTNIWWNYSSIRLVDPLVGTIGK